MRLFISLRPRLIGGGANAFAYNFSSWAERNNVEITRNILKADTAIVIAHNARVGLIRRAKEKGCYIMHRLDEYFQENEDDYRKEKHRKIIEINQYADITVFQSKFVFDNVYPYLKCRQYQIILNGADQTKFFPSQHPGDYIGHVTWGIGDIKRLDMVAGFIESHPEERFLLIGNHHRGNINFRRFKNARVLGAMNRKRLPHFYRMMKMLYFPSEREPCPNIPIEAILSGVPVCYNEFGGTKEIVKDCGLPLSRVDELLSRLPEFRHNCLQRNDLYFDRVAREYILLKERLE